MQVRRLRNLAQWRYAVRETALIVVGVLIALGVNAWWGQRQDRSDERRYLGQLRDDALANESILQSSLAEDSASLDALIRFGDALTTGRMPERPAMEIFDLALRYSDPRPVLGTLDHLIQSGGVELIRDDPLRSSLLEYASLMHADLSEVSRHVELLLTGMTFWIGQQHRAGLTCAMFQETSEAGRAQCNEQFVLAWPQLRENREYSAAVLTVRTATWNRTFYLRRMLSETREFRQAIEASPVLSGMPSSTSEYGG